ncbi:MAG: hypothetical protein QW040_00365 [Candidatus Aenigmatarchaeota archaeon]
MKKHLFILVLLFVSAFSVIVFHKLTKNICVFDLECKWKITNCCPESMGAKWECVNIKSFNELECPKYVICPQFLSPKPNLSCKCERGGCVVR